RSVLRPVRLPDHRDPVRLERLESSLPQFLHAAGASHLPALLWCAPGTLLCAPARRAVGLSSGATGILPTPGLGLALRREHLRCPARLVGPPVHQPLLVARRRRALLPAVAVRGGRCLAADAPEDLRGLHRVFGAS